MDKQILGSYTFQHNPQEMTLIESKKPTSVVETWAGSAVFQWDATLVGRTISLKWYAIREAMYNELRTLYLTTTQLVWNPQTGSSYNVLVTGLEGEYVEIGLWEHPVRKNVEMQLNIRSAV